MEFTQAGCHVIHRSRAHCTGVGISGCYVAGKDHEISVTTSCASGHQLSPTIQIYTGDESIYDTAWSQCSLLVPFQLALSMEWVSGLVSISAGLSSPGTQCTVMSPSSTRSRTKWCLEWCRKTMIHRLWPCWKGSVHFFGAWIRLGVLLLPACRYLFPACRHPLPACTLPACSWHPL